MYYAFIENNKINGIGQCPCLNSEIENVEITEEIYNNIDHYIWNGSKVVVNPNYEEEQAQKERERLDGLALTPSDVERALYKAKGMDFDDLKALIAQQAPQLDIKALAIEFRANNFYRGVEVGGMRLIDAVGAMLGYSPEDMDYLFIHKELPTPDNVEEV